MNSLDEINKLLQITQETTSQQTQTSEVNVTEDAEKKMETTTDTKFTIKTARGTRDYGPGDMIIRSSMMDIICNNFNKFGGQNMETPVFELRDILMDKYGEDEKLIFDLAQQESEILCLRYDLTVPLARYVAMNRKQLKSPFKAARVGRVYRRDQPKMTKGRLREFYQCDYDIVRTSMPKNKSDLIFDDTEIVALIIKQLIDLLNGKEFILKINNRKLLDAILDICQVPNNKIRAISSSIDKLDKFEWSIVKEEMIEKGISSETAEKIYEFTTINGPAHEVLNKLKRNKFVLEDQKNSTRSIEAINEFELLLEFLETYNSEYIKYLRIDMSMVRGLDYYTGIIMEAQFKNKEIAEQYGSIAGGGRFDQLVSRFVSNKESFPCVGASIGFERIFSYLKNTNGISVGVPTDILICELSNKEMGLYKERLKLLNELRINTNFNIETINKIKPNFRDQINYAEQREIKWMCIIGDDEIKNNTVNLRRLILNKDIIITKDGKKGVIQQIVLTDKKPKFKVQSLSGNKSKKDWILHKKEIVQVIQNGIETDLSIKDLSRNALVPFLSKFYSESSKIIDNENVDGNEVTEAFSPKHTNAYILPSIFNDNDDNTPLLVSLSNPVISK